jgi:flagellar biosynthetic protein FlhB
MSDDKDPDGKTEEPTEKKLQDAFEKGDVPVSRELAVLASLAGVLIFIVLLLPARVEALVADLTHFIDDPAGWRLDTSDDAIVLMNTLGRVSSSFLAPIAALLMVLGVTASVAQNAPRVVLARIAPTFSRISPMQGLRRIFGPRGWTEMGKNIFKIAAVSLATAIVIASQKYVIISSMFVEASLLPSNILSLVARIIETIMVAALAIAGADLAWSRILWRRDHRMSQQEVKEELRQLEGDRLMKARLRSIRMDRARRRMLTEVPKATMVIVNPTHYAVALRYVRSEGGAPKVIAKGVDLIALRIRAIAEEAGIPIIEDKPLARSLHAVVTVDSVIPPEFYRAVAEIVHLVQQKMRPGGNLYRRPA